MKIRNTKLGQSAIQNELPWFVCIYHKYEDDYDTFFEHVAFEPKAYNKDDKVLANSSFGFEFSEISEDNTLDIMFRQFDEDRSHPIHNAEFHNQRYGWNDEVQSFAIDYINCEDEKIFEQLITTRSLNVLDFFKDHDNDHQNSLLCLLKGLRSEMPMYGDDGKWTNGLVDQGRKRG